VSGRTLAGRQVTINALNDFAHGRQGTRRTTLLLACAIFLAYLLSSSWRFPLGSDGRAMLATSRSLLTHRTLAVDAQFASDEGFGPSAKVGVDGRAYIKYGLGLPILELPFVAGALVIARWTAVAEPRAIAGVLSLLNPLLTTCTALALFALCRALDCRRAIAWFVMMAYAFGTFAWVYAGTDTSEPLQAFCLILAMLLLVRYRSTGRAALLSGAGLAIAYAILTKPANAVFVPAFLGYAVVVSASERFSFRGIVPALVRLTAPIGACLLALAWLNWSRWGSVLETGYEPDAFTNNVLSGIYGLIFSFNKGIIFFAPLVLLAPVGIGFMRKLRRAEAATILLASLTCILLFSTFYNWGAGWSWGPRYLMPILPLLMAPVASAAAAGRTWRHVAVVLLVAGVAVNGVGVLVDGDAYHSAIMDVDLTERTGFARVGSLKTPGRMVAMAIPPDYVLPAFSEITGKIWLARVAWDGCWCNEHTARCGCRSGALERNVRFSSPPWIERYPDVQATPPYGARLINPWIAHRFHRWLLREVGRVPL
jgi:hypothetical protein